MFIPPDHLAPVAEAQASETCGLSSQQWGALMTPPHPLCLAPPTFYSCSVSGTCFLSIPLASSSLGLLLKGPLTPHVTPPHGPTGSLLLATLHIPHQELGALVRPAFLLSKFCFWILSANTQQTTNARLPQLPPAGGRAPNRVVSSHPPTPTPQNMEERGKPCYAQPLPSPLGIVSWIHPSRPQLR